MQTMQVEPLATTQEEAAPSTDAAPLAGHARYALVPLALVGAGIALYLLLLWIGHRGLPAGCGQGSGCAEVLNSRWSQVLGLPVSGLALGAYAGILIAVCTLSFARIGSQLRWTSTVLVFLATTLVGVAIWFVGLQFFVIKALCPWCLAEHALGLLAAAIVFASTRVFAKTGLLLGVVAVVGLAAAQSSSTFDRRPYSESQPEKMSTAVPDPRGCFRCSTDGSSSRRTSCPAWALRMLPKCSSSCSITAVRIAAPRMAICSMLWQHIEQSWASCSCPRRSTRNATRIGRKPNPGLSMRASWRAWRSPSGEPTGKPLSNSIRGSSSRKQPREPAEARRQAEKLVPRNSRAAL